MRLCSAPQGTAAYTRVRPRLFWHKMYGRTNHHGSGPHVQCRLRRRRCRLRETKKATVETWSRQPVKCLRHEVLLSSPHLVSLAVSFSVSAASSTPSFVASAPSSTFRLTAAVWLLVCDLQGVHFIQQTRPQAFSHSSALQQQADTERVLAREQRLCSIIISQQGGVGVGHQTR